MEMTRDNLVKAAKHVALERGGLFRSADWQYDAAVYPLHQMGGGAANTHQNRQAVVDLIKAAKVTVEFPAEVSV